MGNYCFRFRFDFTNNVSISHNSSAMDIELSDGKIFTITSHGKKSLTDSHKLTITGEGYDSAKQAEDYARRAINSLILSCAKIKRGINLGNFGSQGHFTKEGLEMIGKHSSKPVANDTYDIHIYKCDNRPIFLSIPPVTLSVGTGVSRFEDVFQTFYNKNIQLSDKEKLAFELYNMAHFETSNRARFLMFVIAIESLLDRTDRSLQSKEHIDRLIDLTSSSSLKNNEIESIKGSLKKIKCISIGQAGRNLIGKLLDNRKYYGMSAVRFFMHCYNERSNLTHKGYINDESTLPSLVSELDRFVSELFLAHVESKVI